jgi:outer membrane receptor for ferrienterochelin and colicins
MKRLFILFAFLFSFSAVYGNETIKGKVYGKENDKQRPLPGANIIFLGTANGTSSDSKGNFELTLTKQSELLIISYVGLVSDTVKIDNQDFIEVVLQSSSSSVEDVEVVGKQSSVVLDYKGIENKQTITKRELQKAACCDLSESFETNPSVDVSVTDAITGIKQIEMLGLSGIYTQKSLEAIPYLRGLSSNIGLTFLPGTWINSINVNKGIGSVVNGFESITGQIDIAMAPPF